MFSAFTTRTTLMSHQRAAVAKVLPSRIGGVLPCVAQYALHGIGLPIYAVYYDGYIFGATEAEVKHLAVGDSITVITDDRNQVVRVETNGRTVRDGVPAEMRHAMTPEQHFILSLLSPMRTFPMVIPGHLRARIDRYRILRAQAGETLNTSDIVRQALTLFAYERPVSWPTAEMDGNGKSANIKLPPVVIEHVEGLADFYNQTKSDIARSAIVWFLNQLESRAIDGVF